MKNAWWIPTDDKRPHLERPYLEVPSPYDYMPPEPPRPEGLDEEDDEESPRVIIIEM